LEIDDGVLAELDALDPDTPEGQAAFASAVAGLLPDTSNASSQELFEAIGALNNLINQRFTSLASNNTPESASVAAATLSPAVYVEQRNAAQSVPVHKHANENGISATNTGVWIEASIYNSEQDDDDDIASLSNEYDADTESVAIGFDYALNENTLIGISASYSDIEIDRARTAQDETEIDAYQITAYALRQYGPLQINGQIGYISGDADATRSVLGEEISGDFDLDGFNIQVGANYRFKLGKNSYFTPFVSLQYADISQDSYTEEGGLNLTVEGIDNDYFEGRLGFRVGEQIVTPTSVTDLFFSAAILSDFGSGPDDITINFADQSSTLSVFDSDDERLDLGVGVNWYSSSNYSIGATINGEFSDDFYTVGGRVQFKYDF